MFQTLHNFCTHSHTQMPNVNIFDFDGVLADPIEEGLFQLDITPDSISFMQKMVQRHCLDLSQETLKSAHYICMQAAMLDAGIPIKPGPLMRKTLEGRYHILTARSDRFAVARMQLFIEDNMEDCDRPIKIMHVDHLPKGQMLQMILDRHPNTRYTFFDDREKHVRSARELRNPRLDVFHVDNDMRLVYEEASDFYHDTILDLAL